MSPQEAYKIVAPLIAGPRGEDGALEASYADMVHDHFGRRAFYVADAKALNGRSNGIHHYIRERPKDDPVLGSGHRPNEKTLQRLVSRRPESLASIARAHNALVAIQGAENAEVRALTCLDSKPAAPSEFCYVIRPKTIVPSIYNADRRAITSARENLKLSRENASRAVFGDYANNVFRLLEDGENDETFAVSFSFKRKVEKFFEDQGVSKLLFAADPAKFRRTLEPARGNLIQP